jgi:hydrogenase-4 component F
MLLPALVLVPLLGALVAYLDRSAVRRSLWIVAGALIHLGLVALAWCLRPAPAGPGWLAFDPLGGLVLTLTSVVFLAVALYSVGYQRHEPLRGGRAYASCLLVFLGAATVITLTRHFGLLWVAMEATTLATAPLIYDPADRRSLEAVWKYLVVCSVGIAVALLGIFFLATAQIAGGAAPGRPLMLEDLLAAGPLLHPAWLRGSFVFVLIGFGTKMGLAPMHTWLPDAHGEAPSPISALLSGALLNLAFLAILRELAVLRAAGQGGFAGPLLVGFGLFSVAVAAAFLFGQGNYKRMLAYSSVEHMGILAVGAGLAGVAAYGALLHVLSASLAKALLFLVAGNVWQGTGTKRTREVTGLARRLPVSAALLVAGLLAISGSPPFGPFLSEFTLLTGAVRSGAIGTVVTLLSLQALIFISMGSAVLGMVLGSAPAGATPAPRESLWLVAPPALLLALVLLLGVWIPAGLRQALAAAAAGIGGTAP